MTEPVRSPLPLPSAWKDQAIDYSRPVKELETAYVQPLAQHATVISYKRDRLAFPVIGLPILVAVMSFLVQAMAPRLLLDPDYRTLWNILGFLVLLGVLCWALVMLAGLVVGIINDRGEDEFIAMAPTGIHHGGGGWSAFFPWDDLFEIQARSNYGSKTQPTQRIFLFPWDDEKLFVEDRRRIKWPKIDQKARGNREILAGELAVVDVAVPYWGLKFYHENPEYRGELGTEAGLRRFRQADFPCEEEPEAERRSE